VPRLRLRNSSNFGGERGEERRREKKREEERKKGGRKEAKAGSEVEKKALILPHTCHTFTTLTTLNSLDTRYRASHTEPLL
jgi:hypothetical protein